MSDGRLAVVLVNYNGLADTIECVESLFASTYPDLIVIVIDNASVEDCGCLGHMPGVILKRLESNVGFGVANNIGAEMAVNLGASLILCLNNDTVVDSRAISTMVKRVDDRTIVSAATYYYREPQKLWYGGGRVSRTLGTFRHLHGTSSREVSFISGCCMLFTVGCYGDIGLFDPNYFMYYEDSDYSLKARACGKRLWYEASAQIWHKVGSSSSRHSGLREYYLTRNRRYILAKYRSHFRSSAIIYYYASRVGLVLIAKARGGSAAPYFKALNDYRRGRMGQGSGKVVGMGL